MKKLLILTIFVPIISFAQINDDLYGSSLNFRNNISPTKSKLFIGLDYNKIINKPFNDFWDNGFGGNLTYETSKNNRFNYSFEIGFINYVGRNIIDMNLFGNNLKINSAKMNQIPILVGVNYHLENISIGSKMGFSNLGFQNYNDRLNKFILKPNLDFRFGKVLIEISDNILFTNQIMNLMGISLKFDLFNRNIIDYEK